jgi:putative phosphoribosyl transferase
MPSLSTSELEMRAVTIPAGQGIELAGDLAMPAEATGLVLFAHGSGSSRHSSRNRFVALELNRAGLATLLFDLLTEREEDEERYTRHLRFDINLLSRRLVAATDWDSGDAALHDLPVGYFGASTGAAAALVAAASRADRVRAVVSRGGRPDLAGDALPHVQAPTLLIVGGADEGVIELNQQARAALRCEKRLDIVPGATHLFEEPGALERVAALAREWFVRHLHPVMGSGGQ